MGRYFTLFLFSFSICLSQGNYNELNNIPGNLKDHYLKQKFKDNTSDEFSLLNNKNLDSKFSENDSLDSLYDDDSLSTKINSKEQLSFYERLFSGDTINPDSQILSLKIFGSDIFSSKKPISFTPTIDFPIPYNYTVNIEDEINILLWGRINEEYTLKVTKEGSINIPRLGPISVSGLTFETMQKNIKNRISQMEGVNVSVSMGTLKSIGIYIIGEVNKPGYYNINALSSITNALFYAEGINKNGSLRNITLKRNGKKIATVDLYDFILNGISNTNLRLLSGDVIHVPFVSKVVAVSGNVRRPAIYELKNNDNLSDVFKYAGGLAPSAWTNKIQIHRYINNNQLQIFDLDSTQNKFNSILINDGDIIKIFPTLYKNINSIILQGNVLRPGYYEYKESMRISNIINDYQQLLPETYLEYALIIRQNPPQYQEQMLPFNLKKALDSPKSAHDFKLQPRDKILIYNRDFFEPDRTVEIAGSITSPGKIKLLHNMTIRDLILQAGGLSEDASSTRGELYRRVSLEDDTVKTVKIDFCVESAMNNDSLHNYFLLKSDKVFIRSKLGWQKEAKVTLKGQFNFPGTYIIFEGETLGDLIERAGGFTENAYLSAAVFKRVSVKEKEKDFFDEYNKQFEDELLTMAAKASPEEAKLLLEQQQSIKKGMKDDYKFGRVVINLLDEKSYKGFALENGDEIFIPMNLNTISVLGQVYNPSTFQFNFDSSNVKYYLEAAGGTKTESDKKHIYVIKANGSIITNSNRNIMNVKLNPGDAIVVPQKIRYSNPHKIFVETVSALGTMTAVLTSVVLLINQMK